MKREIHVAKSSDDLNDYLQQVIETSFKKCSAKRFCIGVSGGSLIKSLSQVLKSLSLSQDEWKKWLIFLVDERLVPFDDEESTFGSYVRLLLPNLTGRLTAANFVPVDSTLIENPQSCAGDYELRMRSLVDAPPDGFPQMDLVLLGMGPDGHTASLFPSHPVLKEAEKWILAVTDSPKPPAKRITFSLPLINSSKDVAFVATGSSKSDVIRDILVDNSKEFPSALVSAVNKLTWILDNDSAKYLPSDLYDERDVDEDDHSPQNDSSHTTSGQQLLSTPGAN